MKTWQMIKTLRENPKAQFKNNRCEDIVSVHKDGFLTWNKKGTPYEITFAGFDSNCFGNSKDEWEEVPEPVDFMAAANSGKRIRHESWAVREFDTVKDALMVIASNCPSVAKGMLNGKWYIES